MTVIYLCFVKYNSILLLTSIAPDTYLALTLETFSLQVPTSPQLKALQLPKSAQVK